jgi:hypothetical protein
MAQQTGVTFCKSYKLLKSQMCINNIYWFSFHGTENTLNFHYKYMYIFVKFYLDLL